MLFLAFGFLTTVEANSNVHVTRFWHNHQPIYWPEWNSGVGQDDRVQYAHDSMRLKPTQNYGAAWNHPHNDLEQIFGLNDRIAAYQGRPRDSLQNIDQAGGFGMSYTGSLIDNIRNLAANGWNYGGDWNSGNTQARQWTTPSGGPRLDMVGFSYHHSLTPLLPKEVFRKEVQIFKQAWWKAWGGNGDLSDHSKGFFPTEMAYSRDIIDVLVDEGYEWVIVASHHISRTSPSYMDRVTPNFNINSSPPNRADMLGPRFDNADQWWRDEPNPGQAAWNVAPFAYQLHRVEYVDPNTGDTKSMIAVPSDDVLSYQAGYSGAQIGVVDGQIAPHTGNDPNRPSLVMPATDGDNAWGGGFSSWMESTPSFFGEAQNRGYQLTTMQDFVDAYGQHAPTAHIEEGAWIYPEMCYGSPNFLKWIEPPVRPSQSSPTTYPNTVIDIENGWALKFFAYAPKMAGANWVITAEQILRDEGGDVQAWKIQAPYDWDGTDTNPNEVELAWHIYLKGLDSGFQYYGGLGNDDETKPGLAARRAIEKLQGYMSTRMHLDETGPTVLKPQRFPYNPGGKTFGWFNHVPEGDGSYLKENPSWFYIWTLAHDVSGIETMNLKIRHTHNNENFRNGHHDNLTYAGGANVSDWATIPMTKRVLPNTREELNAIASHGEIDFVVTSPEIADQYFAKIDDSVYPNFRGRYFDYYIEAVDTRGNVTRTEIQHVFVEDDGELPSSGVQFSADPRDCAPLGVTYHAANGPLEGVSPVVMQISFDGGDTWAPHTMTNTATDVWDVALEVPGKPASAIVWFQNSDGSIVDSRDGQNWTTSIRDCDAPVGPRVVTWDPQVPDGCGTEVTVRYYPNEGILQGAAQINIHHGFNGWTGTETEPMTQEGIYWEYVITVPDDTYEINMVFNDGTTWDNNSGNDWHITVINCSDDEPLPTVSTIPAEPVGCDPVTIRYNPVGRPIVGAEQVYIHIGRNGWSDVIDPAPAMTWEGNHWSYTYSPMPAGTEVLNFVFNDGAGNWDNNNGNDWYVNIADCDDEDPPPPPPTGLAITNPPSDIVVGNAVTTYDLQGIAEDIEGEVSWSNTLTGASGAFPAVTPWSLPGVALGVGDNVITVSGEIPGSGEIQIVAEDTASNYVEWTHDSNEGAGFGAWSLSADENAGHFSNENGWGFWAHPGNLSEAIRPFSQPLTSGQTFSVHMRNGDVRMPGEEEEYGGGVGVALQNAAGDTLWQFWFNGGDEFYNRSGGQTDVGWTPAGIDLSMELTGATTYTLTVHPQGGAAQTYAGEWEENADQVVARFRAWSWDNGVNNEDNDFDFFVDDLAVTEPGTGEPVWTNASVTITRSAEEGDSNGDGVPDSWYIGHGLDPNIPNLGDQVADNGYTYRASYLMDLDPADDSLPPFEMGMNGSGKFMFTGPTGRSYMVQYKDDLMQPIWSNLHSLGVGEDLEDGDNMPYRFYRIRFEGMGE